ncbi:hypothetical protein GUITHDRAFT_106222 [Guillardia theta CCMP2712]|uniref:Uncharacterized protein n=2 Tax=Guillardia theta TaxID=55529 RepID=L1JI18_GUITC|nr:hypothetical protein GUITHDRAFT_106222 [Guillardia theta CCMP2712]EKX48146.1 hypothetical protein GUITHDRAFT_106222 [Guillardia theta CCMP2712]|eukprot:XP_005835126.1 hypothetical protein GUITHDRAFT_106222 [Guillardia theta CCMP2712]
MNKEKEQGSHGDSTAPSQVENLEHSDKGNGLLGCAQGAQRKDDHQTYKDIHPSSKSEGAVAIDVPSSCSPKVTPHRTRSPEYIKGDSEQRSKRKLFEISRRGIVSGHSESEQDYMSEDDSDILLFRGSVYRDLPDILTFGTKHVRTSKIS